MKLILLILNLVLISAGAERFHPNAHAHNDYEHTRPLLDALDHGFCSVEADIHLVQGKLLVAHDAAALSPENTLEALYLHPLHERLRRNEGRVFKNGPSLLLLIDIKTEALSTYQALEHALQNYREMLTLFTRDRILTNAVTVFISGNRPREHMLNQNRRLAAFDGRVSDLHEELPKSFMPLVSDNWQAHFTWKGQGTFPSDEREKLRTLVNKVHTQGRKLRFWATPDNEQMWGILKETGVDLINTDKLQALDEFLSK